MRYESGEREYGVLADVNEAASSAVGMVKARLIKGSASATPREGGTAAGEARADGSGGGGGAAPQQLTVSDSLSQLLGEMAAMQEKMRRMQQTLAASEAADAPGTTMMLEMPGGCGGTVAAEWLPPALYSASKGASDARAIGDAGSTTRRDDESFAPGAASHHSSYNGTATDREASEPHMRMPAWAFGLDTPGRNLSA